MRAHPAVGPGPARPGRQGCHYIRTYMKNCHTRETTAMSAPRCSAPEECIQRVSNEYPTGIRQDPPGNNALLFALHCTALHTHLHFDTDTHWAVVNRLRSLLSRTMLGDAQHRRAPQSTARRGHVPHHRQ